MQPASSQSARSRVAGLSGRTATRPRSAPASSPAPAISSTAAAAAGRTSRGVKRGRRDRQGPAGPQGVPGPKGAAGKGIEPPSAAEIQLRNHPPKGLRAVPGKPNLARLAKLKPSLGADGVWAFSSFHDQDVSLASLKDAFTPKGVSHLDVPAGKYVVVREGRRLLGVLRRARIRALLARGRRGLGHLLDRGTATWR